MPRLDPRQHLIREALLGGVAGAVALAAAIWWAVHVPSAPQALATRNATTAMAPSTAPAPTACLWRPLSDKPETVVAPAPPPPPAMRLISLSRRDHRWTALIDPGNGTGLQRVTGGEQVAGWRVDAVGQDAVELSSGDRRHQLKFGP